MIVPMSRQPNIQPGLSDQSHIALNIFDTIIKTTTTWVVDVLIIVLKWFKAICVWYDSPGLILGYLVTGTVTEEHNDKKISTNFLDVVSISVV